MKIIEKYIEQENGKDKVYYDEWTKRKYRKQITKYYEEKEDYDDDEEEYESIKDILFTKSENIYEKTIEDIEKEEINVEHIINFKKEERNRHIVILHKNEYNRILNKIKDLENKVILQNKKIEDLTQKHDIKVDEILEDNIKNNIYTKSCDGKEINISNNNDKIDHENDIIDNIELISKDNNENKENEIEIQIQKYEHKLKIIKEEKDNTINELKKELHEIKEKSINKDICKIASQDRKQDNSKYSNLVINRIIKFYNTYEEEQKKLNYGGNEVDKIKIKISEKYDTINKNKSEIIYENYELYKNYLMNKKIDNSITLIKFIGNDGNIDRYGEKVKRCYEFFNDIFEITKEIPFGGYGKIFTIIRILKQCRLSIDKLYKIRKDNYDELIKFLNPILIERCKKEI